MIAWTPQGPLLSLTAASSAPTSVRVTSQSQVTSMQVKFDNVSATIDAVMGWGQSDAEAKANAAAAADCVKCFYLLRGTVQVVTIPNGAYVTGISVSSTAVVKVQSGIGN